MAVMVLEELDRLIHPQIQDVGNRKAAVADLERLAVEPLALAHGAGHVQIGQEVHLDPPLPLALALLAAAALDVETEAARLVAQGPGVAGAGKDLANLVEHAGVGGRVAAGRAADRRLVDLDHLVDLAGPAKARVRARLGRDAAQPADQGPGQRLVQERALAGTAHARHADQRREGKAGP